MDRRRERNVVEDEANPPVVEQQETESDLWSDLLESFSSPAIVVETAEAPRFHVTWNRKEKQQLITYLVEAVDEIQRARVELSEGIAEDKVAPA